MSGMSVPGMNGCRSQVAGGELGTRRVRGSPDPHFLLLPPAKRPLWIADLQIGMICHFALNTSEISIPRSFFQSCFIRYVPNLELLEPASPATLRSHLQRSPMVSGHPLPGASRTFGPALPWADHNRAYSPPFIAARQPFFLSLGVGIAIAFETLY